MEQASNGLKLTDLNDFINPSKNCVKPLITNVDKSTDNETVLLKKKSNNLNGNPKKERNIGKIKLDDCLACSGCVTSAEVVFIEQQSINEFLDFISFNKQLPEREKRVLAISVSPQSVFSLANALNITIENTISLIVDYFKRDCGAKFVFDHFEINNICIEESSLEFVKLYNEATKERKNVRVFSSSCPGWACYAEKRCQNEIVNQLSHVRSIQGVMGGLIKRILPVDPHKIYHLAVMPCFDRKLEAARPDMILKLPSINQDELKINETDIVITTYELYHQLLTTYGLTNSEHSGDNTNHTIQSLIMNKTLRFDSIYIESLSKKYFFTLNPKQLSIFYRNIGGESGGLAINIFINACIMLFNVKVEVIQTVKNGVSMETVTTYDPAYNIRQEYIKSSDYYEFWLERASDTTTVSPEVLLRFAKVYGFRSIQNMLIRLKKLPANYYQYIEVMACPNGGCLNGGGQVLFHTQNSVLKKNQLIKVIRNEFNELPIATDNNDNNECSVNQLLSINQIPLTTFTTSFRKLTSDSTGPKIENHSIIVNW